MIGILDYGLGNVMAFRNIYKWLNIPACTIENAKDISSMTRLILPGVGSFDWAMSKLRSSGMFEALNEAVLDKRVPILGVCVGMQMMAQRSDEGNLEGLGWVDATVHHFSKLTDKKIDLPHMGWNDVIGFGDHPLFENVEKSAIFYFLHSYYFHVKSNSKILSQTDYGKIFTSSIQQGNIFGVQFHPEKSHRRGVQLLKNFAELQC